MALFAVTCQVSSRHEKSVKLENAALEVSAVLLALVTVRAAYDTRKGKNGGKGPPAVPVSVKGQENANLVVQTRPSTCQTNWLHELPNRLVAIVDNVAVGLAILNVRQQFREHATQTAQLGQTNLGCLIAMI